MGYHMKKKVFLEGMVLFLATFSNIKAGEKTQNVWYTLLQDLTDDEFGYAVKKVCQEVKKFFPSDNFAALIREQLVVDVEEQALIAWGAVKKGMLNHGSYSSVKFSDPIIHSVIKIMASGWSEFCQLPVDKWMMKDFITNYRVMSKRADHPEYLKGIFEIENTAHGYPDHIKKPRLIETGTTGPRRQISGDNNVMRLAEKLDKKMKVGE